MGDAMPGAALIKPEEDVSELESMTEEYDEEEGTGSQCSSNLRRKE